MAVPFERQKVFDAEKVVTKEDGRKVIRYLEMQERAW